MPRRRNDKVTCHGCSVVKVSAGFVTLSSARAMMSIASETQPPHTPTSNHTYKKILEITLQNTAWWISARKIVAKIIVKPNYQALFPKHYNDVIMSAMTPQITSLTIAYSLTRLFKAHIKENTSKIRGDRWIPRTKGQWRRICFHLMT